MFCINQCINVYLLQIIRLAYCVNRAAGGATHRAEVIACRAHLVILYYNKLDYNIITQRLIRGLLMFQDV